MSYTLLYAETLPPSSLGPLVENGVEAHCIHVVSDLVPNEQPTVFVLDAASRTAFPVAALRAFVDAGGAVVAVGRPGESDVPDGFPLDLLSGFVPSPTGLARLLETLSAPLRRGPRRPSSGRQLLVAVHAGYREAAARAATARARKEAMLRASEVRELTTISAKLMTERDPAKLVDDILTQARQFSQSDAGSLYLVEKDEETGIKRLRFKWAQNFSKPDIPFKESTIPIDSSNLAGYTASTGEPLVIDDVYALPPDAGFTFDRSFDERFGYRTQSMLLLPMRDHKDTIIGVLQLINRKRTPDARLDTPTDVEREVVPFSRRTVELVGALAGQAAVSIENSQLYDRINRMFREFVDASVQAIEQRDPITKGHSKRVAGRTVGLANAADRAGMTNFSRDQIREIEYAALLHDFGKVGVKEDVLQKEKKLYPDRLELIKQRHAFVRRSMERDFWRARVEFLERYGQEGYADFLAKLDDEQRRDVEQLDQFLRTVITANEPNLLAADNAADLTQFGGRTYIDIEGQDQPLLTSDEVRFLTIRKGSLDDGEREQINSHVTHTWNFLQEIKWTPELSRIPIIAYGHHEKLDGSGYPRGISGDAIPIQTRMMTISDIYDALTAPDRPYKKSVQPDSALDIMQRELVARGQLDRELFTVFIDARIFAIDVPT